MITTVFIKAQNKTGMQENKNQINLPKQPSAYLIIIKVNTQDDLLNGVFSNVSDIYFFH